jgi:opacity protein-like surface antigen
MTRWFLALLLGLYMMKKITFLTVLSLLSASAQAYSPYIKNHKPKKYIRLDTGFIFKNQIEDNPGDSSTAAATTGTKYPIYKTNQSIFGGGAIGYEFMEDYRGELSFIYNPFTKTKIEKEDNSYTELSHSSIAAFANIYFSPHEFEILTPYAFFGMGFARNRVSAIKDFNSTGGLLNTQAGGGNTHYAWNLGAGITLDFTENILFDLGYRFINYGTLKSSMRGTYGPVHAQSGSFHNDPTYNYNFGKLKAHQITLSLRYFVK